MSVNTPVRRILDKGRKPNYRIQQHCKYCDTVLAFEFTDKIGTRGSDCWVNKSGIFVKERWFGNWIKCPKCGREGKLPGDKPLNAESILQPTEDVLEMDKRIQAKLKEKIDKAKGERNGTSSKKDRPIEA